MRRNPLTCLLIVLAIVTAYMLPTVLHARKGAVRQDAELVVQAAAMGLSGILRNVESREDQILMIRDFVRPARFFSDDSGYFFVFDQNGVCQAHGAQPELEGVNLYKLKDANNVPIVQLMLEISKNGGGFIEYLWPKPGEHGDRRKLGYVQSIPGTDYILGSGVYFPTAW